MPLKKRIGKKLLRRPYYPPKLEVEEKREKGKPTHPPKSIKNAQSIKNAHLPKSIRNIRKIRNGLVQENVNDFAKKGKIVELYVRFVEKRYFLL
jgi:hypothetical protein